MNLPRIGAHVSSAGGAYRCFENAAQLGAETLQIFGASPRQWAAKVPAQKECDEFKKRWRESRVKTVYLHAAYLVNLASADQILFARSVKNLSDHLKIAEALGATGLIFHLGSGGPGLLPEAATQNVVRGMREVLKSAPGAAYLIMENSAGGGNKVGSTLAQIGEIFKAVNSPRVKVCFDTAHAFEAGIVKEYSAPEVKKLCSALDGAVGLENLIAIHANDSRTPHGSHHDQHENIGQGHIGLPAFKNLFKEKQLSGKDWILEVPGFDGMGPDKKNMEILQNCAEA